MRNQKTADDVISGMERNLGKFGLLVVAMGLVLAACGQNNQSGATSTDAAETTSTTPSVTVPTPDLTTPLPPGTDVDYIEMALSDLASRVSTPLSDLEVIRAERGYWSDGSIGCPEDGKAYIQMLVQGYRILIKDGDIIHSYHQGGQEKPFLCENPRLDDFTVDKTAPQPSIPPPID